MTPLPEPIWLRKGGQGPLIAMIHGLDDQVSSWRPLVRQLDPRFRVVAFDMPWRSGAGFSWRRRCVSGAWVAQTLEASQLRPDVIVGHSFGANAVLEALTEDDPPPCDQVVLIAPFYRPPDMPVTWELFDKSRASFDRTLKAAMILRLGPRARRLDDDLLQRMQSKRWTHRHGPIGFMAVFDQYAATGDLDVSRVTPPTLVIGGTHDTSLARGVAQELVSRLPRGELVLRDHYAHFCQIEQAEELADDVEHFLSAHRSDGGHQATDGIEELRA